MIRGHLAGGAGDGAPLQLPGNELRVAAGLAAGDGCRRIAKLHADSRHLFEIV